MHLTVELVYFDGCPHVATARTHLREALAAAGLPLTWREWEQDDPHAPAHAQRHPSPTVLINGNDATGAGIEVGTRACRADGAPTTEGLTAALLAAVRPPRSESR